MFGSDKIVEIAIDEIRGYLEPSEAERAAAYELVVELATRTATAPLRSSEGTVREALTSLHALFGITRGILREHGVETSKGSGGNLSMALVAVRVLNEVFRPVLSRWHPELSAWEAKRQTDAPTMSEAEWERRWPMAERCRADLRATRAKIRLYVDTLSRIAGAPEIADAVQAPPPSIMLASAVERPRGNDGDANARSTGAPAVDTSELEPRRRMVRWLGVADNIAMLRSYSRVKNRIDDVRRPSGLEPTAEFRAEKGSEFWFDYAADMGDGFDGTAPVAWLLGRDSISLPDDPWDELPAMPAVLPRGELLVFGGDEVYPNAFEGCYEKHLELPYALGVERGLDPDAPRPTLVAIPGNHDWMGGLDHFDEFFTRGRPFADFWSTVQDAPYFSVKLPQGWWIWGIDTGLHNEMEPEQYTYFTEAASLLKPGDRVVMCTPVPMFQLRQKFPEAYRRLQTFFEGVIEQQDAHAPLWLSADTHVFAHFERTGLDHDQDHIMAGGGGAFLHPTHNLPERIPLERGATEFELSTRWPRPADSRALAQGAADIAKDPHQWTLAAIFGGLYAGIVGLSRVPVDALDMPPDDTGQWWHPVLDVVWSPAIVLLAAITLLGSLGVKANSQEPRLTRAAKNYGLLTGAGIAAAAAVVATGQRALDDLPAGIRWPAGIVIGGLAMLLAFFAMTKWTNARIKANDTVAYSPGQSTRYKHFLRFRIDLEGDLTCYVVGIDPVGKGWWEALTDDGDEPGGRLIPPWDPAGIPRAHYVWGKTFRKFRPAPMRIAISISDAGDDDMGADDLFLRVCEPLIEQGHTLLYGGRPSEGYTQRLWELEQRVHADNPNRENHMINYVADYIPKPDAEPGATDRILRIDVAHPPDGASESPLREIDDLTAMRKRMNRDSRLRIVIGGDLRPGSPGARLAPGIVEEAYLAVVDGVPLVVAGGFGGAAKLIADALLDNGDPAHIQELCGHLARDIGDRPGLDEMLRTMNSISLLRNGLTPGENRELLTTRDPRTAVRLINRSVRRLSGRTGV